MDAGLLPAQGLYPRANRAEAGRVADIMLLPSSYDDCADSQTAA